MTKFAQLPSYLLRSVVVPGFIRPTCLVVLSALIGLGGCKTLEKKKEKVETPAGTLRDQAGDVSFQAFISTLRQAAAKKDVDTMANMMTVDFGYSWEPGGEGAGVFDYWNKHNLWREINVVLKEKFVPSGDYMVAPSTVTVDPDYPGYRAGMRLVNGGWRFAYFVPAAPGR